MIVLDSSFLIAYQRLFVDAFKTFASQGSGRMSFVDAAITTLARRNDPGFVATFDADFRDLSGVTVVPD